MPASQQHDHNHCITTAMDTARSLCEERGLRMTPVRRRVLELVWQNHKPTGAYDLLAQLSEEGFNSAPPTVYRALDFLLELGVMCCRSGSWFLELAGSVSIERQYTTYSINRRDA